MKKEKKQPMRQCVVCREKFTKRDLLRIVRNADGELFFDPTGKAAGRGAYICKNPDCAEKFLKRPNLERAFRANIDKDAVESVKSQLQKYLEEEYTVKKNSESGDTEMN